MTLDEFKNQTLDTILDIRRELNFTPSLSREEVEDWLDRMTFTEYEIITEKTQSYHTDPGRQKAIREIKVYLKAKDEGLQAAILWKLSN